jgi:hypothetical protein
MRKALKNKRLPPLPFYTDRMVYQGLSTVLVPSLVPSGRRESIPMSDAQRAAVDVTEAGTA